MTHDNSDIGNIVHLPECREPLCDWSDPDSWECLGYGDCDHICICNELRACEQRVRQETFDADWSEMGQLAAVRIFRRQAYNAGIDAARAAIIQTCHHTKYEGCRPCPHDDAIRAIETL